MDFPGLLLYEIPNLFMILQCIFHFKNVLDKRQSYNLIKLFIFIKFLPIDLIHLCSISRLISDKLRNIQFRTKEQNIRDITRGEVVIYANI